MRASLPVNFFSTEYGDLKEGIHRIFMPGLDMVMVTKKEHLRQVRTSALRALVDRK